MGLGKISPPFDQDWEVEKGRTVVAGAGREIFRIQGGVGGVGGGGRGRRGEEGPGG